MGRAGDQPPPRAQEHDGRCLLLLLLVGEAQHQVPREEAPQEVLLVALARRRRRGGQPWAVAANGSKLPAHWEGDHAGKMTVPGGGDRWEQDAAVCAPVRMRVLRLFSQAEETVKERDVQNNAVSLLCFPPPRPR